MIHSLYGSCPYLGGSIIGGFTVMARHGRVKALVQGNLVWWYTKRNPANKMLFVITFKLMFRGQLLEQTSIDNFHCFQQWPPGGWSKSLCVVVLLDPLAERLTETGRAVLRVVVINNVDVLLSKTEVATELFPLSRQWAALQDHHIPVLLLCGWIWIITRYQIWESEIWDNELWIHNMPPNLVTTSIIFWLHPLSKVLLHGV